MAEIVLRQNKTSALLFAEMDSNLDNINTELVANTTFLNAATDNNVINTLVLRNNSGDISVSTVNGNLNGTASLVNATADNTNAVDQFVPFIESGSGSNAVKTDTTLKYNPNTNTLKADIFSGTAALTSLNNTGNTTLGASAGDTLTVNATATFAPNVIMNSNLAVNGGTISSTSPAVNLFNTTPTTVNFANAATSITIGAVTGTTAIRNAVTIQGGTAWHSGNDGSGSGLDADVLDGFQSSQSTANNTVVVRTGTGGINASTGTFSGDVAVNGGNITTTIATANLFNTTPTTVNIANAATSLTLGALTGTTAIRNAVTIQGGTAWHSGNDGSGSGLDADVLDGFQSSQTTANNTVVVRTASGGINAAAATFTGTVNANNGTLATTNATGNVFNTGATTLNIGGAATSIEIGAPTGVTDINNTLTVAGNLVWHQGNDGAGSGLDADTVDGFNPSVSALANTIVVRDGNGVINGTIAGTTDNANKVAVSSDNTAGTFFPTFATNADINSGYAPLYADNGLSPMSYVPSTGTLTASVFSGALSGNATTATTLQTTRTINSVSFNGSSNIVVEPFVEDDDASAATRYLTFVDTSAPGYKRLNESSSLTFNPSTNTLSTTNFSGALIGNATTASTLQTARTISLGGDLSGSASFNGGSNITISATINANSVALGTDTTGNYIGTGATSGNGISGSATGEGSTFTVTSNATAANTANTIVFRDASGNFNAGTITASLVGNASTATTLQTARTINNVSFNGGANITVEPFVERDDASAAERRLVFVDNDIAAFHRLNMDTALTFNPSTNTLTASTFNGNLTGNASTASSAAQLTTARTINGVSFNGTANITVEPFVEDDDTTNATRYLTFVDNSTAGHKRLNEDVNLTYNPGTNTLTAVTFAGSLSGNATTASTLQTARTISLSGGVTGSASFNGGSNITINATVANDSHTHDGRYYTEAESDGRFLGISAKAADSNLLDGIDSSSFARTDINEVFDGDITVNGGDIILGGTGRIQGIDTVSAGTDAANKTYVDSQLEGVVVASGTANALTLLDFDVTALLAAAPFTARRLEIRFNNLRPSTAQDLWCRVRSASSNTTYSAANQDHFSVWSGGSSNGPSSFSDAANSQPQMVLATNLRQYSINSNPAFARYMLENPSDTIGRKCFSGVAGYTDSITGATVTFQTTGIWVGGDLDQAITGVRILPSAGNFSANYSVIAWRD